MNWSLFKVIGGIYDGRFVLEHNDTNYKIVLATSSLPTKCGVKMLSYDKDGNSQHVNFVPTNFIEQKRLTPHLLKKIKNELQNEVI